MFSIISRTCVSSLGSGMSRTVVPATSEEKICGFCVTKLTSACLPMNQ